ncbi:MAG: hypothetical protein ACK4OM_06330 [Alphaproteobacteria bacterium]
MIELDEKFWLAISFLLLIIALYKPLKNLLIKMLDERSNAISNELAEARIIREEAEKLLLSYKEKERQLDEHVNKIVQNAEEQVQLMLSKAKNDLDLVLSKRSELTLLKIENYEKEAIKEISNKAVDIAFAAIYNLIKQTDNRNFSNDLIDASIDQISKKLH